MSVFLIAIRMLRGTQIVHAIQRTIVKILQHTEVVLIIEVPIGESLCGAANSPWGNSAVTKSYEMPSADSEFNMNGSIRRDIVLQLEGLIRIQFCPNFLRLKL